MKLLYYKESVVEKLTSTINRSLEKPTVPYKPNEWHNINRLQHSYHHD